MALNPPVDFGISVPADWNLEPNHEISYGTSGQTITYKFTSVLYATAAAWAEANCYPGKVSAPLSLLCNIDRDGDWCDIRLSFTYGVASASEQNGGAFVNGSAYGIEPQTLMKPLATAPYFLATMKLASTLTKQADTVPGSAWINETILGGKDSAVVSIAQLAVFGHNCTPGERGYILGIITSDTIKTKLTAYWELIDLGHTMFPYAVPLLKKTTYKTSISAGDWVGYGTSLETSPSGFPWVPSEFKYVQQPSVVNFDRRSGEAIVVNTWLGVEAMVEFIYSAT